MRSNLLVPFLLVTTLAGCAAMESVWDTTVSVFDSDTGEESEVAIGDMVADAASSDAASGIIGSLLSTNPALAAIGGAAAAALAGNARRKRKLKVEAEKKG